MLYSVVLVLKIIAEVETPWIVFIVNSFLSCQKGHKNSLFDKEVWKSRKQLENKSRNEILKIYPRFVHNRQDNQTSVNAC